MNTTTPAKFVSYLRVSTTGQGDSGLGIEAQREAVRVAVAAKGGVLVREFLEVASGGDNERPELVAALEACKRTKATLVVAKLDRLSRDVELIARTMKRTPLVVAECAGAGSLELHLRAAFAAEERAKIRTRTTEALAALKARGVKLGSSRPGHWKGREHVRQAAQVSATKAAAASRRAASADVYREARRVASTMPNASLRAIAKAINEAGITTPGGSTWQAATVARMLEAAAA
jgi:DNA invertase Pin-like site-specific DNA recombinase